MERALLDVVLCPVCNGTLSLSDGAEVAAIEYAGGVREEVRHGTVECACGQRYPVERFVLSFASLFDPVLAQEAAYWERYYLWLLEHGSYGFHDLRLGQAPYITHGVPEPFPAADSLDRYDIHHRIAEDPLVRKGHTLLDIGVGLGWTSLYFARAGYAVTAFEPSRGPVTAAKRYAMEQGIFVEYICSAMGAISFRPCSFDSVTAFHSLHHVPNLEIELHALRSWLCPGGALALDEHVGNSRLAAAIGGQVNAWAEAEVFPNYRTLSEEALESLPSEPHSAREDASVDELLPLVRRVFNVRAERARHVFLDHYPLIYYLQEGRDLTAFRHALAIANQLQELIRRVDEEGGDYVTIIAENSTPEAAPPDALPDGAASDSHILEATATAPQPSAPESQAASRRISELERQLAEQSLWAGSLQSELHRKNAELERLSKHLKRLESGLVMRVMRFLPMRER
ncbi:MAG: class I SAM-dependent methyltransferase [Chloroflexi bacterium]|nr:class I SAM-dependent methyltransferase [Chloroflexota bacterium]